MSTQDDNSFNLKTNFLYGLFVLLPIIVTIWLVKFSISLLSGPLDLFFGQHVPPLLSVAISLIVITLVGVLAKNFIGKMVLSTVEGIMARIPVINIIYKSTKQVINAFSFQEKKLLGAVLLEYPRPGTWALGFITREFASGVKDKDGNDLVEGMCAVFVPTTPNPTSGYFLYVKHSEVKRLDMSIEDSVKILMSAGVLSSEQAAEAAGD